ncbi:hypothetical protein ACTJNK_26495 [Achromobacter anxifer]
MLRFFSGLRIGARLSGAFLLVAVIGGAIGAFGVWGLARINEGRSEELDFKHPKIDLMTKVFKNG